jgi:hypothetical protein
VTTTTPEPSRRRSIALILSPAGILLLSAARLIIVANFNSTTAVTIASSGGYVNAFLGSVIPLIPIFAPYFALTLLLFRRFLLSLIVFIFAAFITPTPVSLGEMIRLASADWQRLGQVIPHSEAAIAVEIVIISVAVFGPLWAHHRELAEAAGAVILVTIAVALLLTTPRQRSSLQGKLLSAAVSEANNQHQLVNFTVVHLMIILAIVISIIMFVGASFPRLLSIAIAIIVTVALFPYVSALYPIPHQANYYSKVLHEVWLPAEKIVMHSGHIYYGYILSSDPTWDTVLLTSRTIVYLHADDVVRRSVCEPRRTPQPAPNPPLIPLLYTPPSPTPPCASTRSITLIQSISILSHGQSLNAISLKVHAWPYRIILLTNAMLGYHLSGAMRRYEYRRNWYAPTPIGQRLWYGTNWPKVRPQPVSKKNFPCPFGTIIEMSGIMVCR